MTSRKAIDFLILLSILCSLSSYGFVNSCCVIEYLRIVKQFVDVFPIQCPLQSADIQLTLTPDQIFWVNEDLDYNKPSSQVSISSSNLIDRSKAQILVNQKMNYVSCGYLSNGLYVRLKLWRLIFIDTAEITLTVKTNPTILSLTQVNDTVSTVNVPSNNNPKNWIAPVDLMRLGCVTNYDLPYDTRFIWMYFYNPKTGSNEIWHKNEADLSPQSIYQIFIYDQYNSLTNKNATISEFLKMLLLNQINSIDLQCASYCNNQILVSKSKNLTLIRGNNTFSDSGGVVGGGGGSSGSIGDNTALIVGAVLGSILGLLLLIGLILLLVFCCCCRKSKNKNSQKVTIINHENSDAHSVIVPYTIISNANTNATSLNSRNLQSLNADYLDNNKVDRSMQFSNELDANLNRNESRLTTTETETIQTETIQTVHAVPPSVYFKMLSNLPTETTMSFNNNYSNNAMSNGLNQEDSFDYKKYQIKNRILPGTPKNAYEEFYQEERREFYNDNLNQQTSRASTNFQFV